MQVQWVPPSPTELERDRVAARARALAAGAPTACPCCVELATGLNEARCEASYWRAMHRKALERENELKHKLEELEAKLKLRERQLFGRKNESRAKSNDEASGGKPPSGPKRKRGQQPDEIGHGRRSHEHLPEQPEVRDLGEHEKVCATCGLPLEPFAGTEDSELLEIEVRAYRRVIRRKRYKHACTCPGQPAIVAAPAAPKLIPKGSLGVSVWVLLLLDKFLFQRPTYRLLAALRCQSGMGLAQGTVTDGLKRLAPLFAPLYAGIIARNLSEGRWHADETRWLVYEQIEGKQTHNWYLWVFLSATAVAFVLDPSRSAEVPKTYFGKEASGILSVDRYAAYKALAAATAILLAFCWAHVRRDFLGVVKDWGGPHEAWGLLWLARIGKLYELNARRLSVLDKPEAFQDENSKLVEALDEMVVERDAELADSELHPARRKVLKSLKEHWSGLTLFVKHPEVPMDNNPAERIQRPEVVGRKNYGGSGARWSGELAAMLFSLFQTLLLCRLNPHPWLTAYLEACANHGGQAPPDAEQWLPWNLDSSKREAWALDETEAHDSS